MGKNLAFDASNAVESFDFNLAPYADSKGTVPEPSSDQVAQFYTDLQTGFEAVLPADRVADYDLSSPTDLLKLNLSLTVDETKALYDRHLDTYAAVCQGTPSRDDLEALPFRLRQAFYGALVGWLRPEA